MAGFRLTGGTGGCPPTETPPSDYENQFRFDDAGRLWLKPCFEGFKFLGSARHDISTNTVFGISSTPISTAEDIVSGNGITAGTYANVTITNDTPCDMGVLLAYDLSVDLYVADDHLAVVALSGRWNGAHHSQINVSSVYHAAGSGDGIRVLQAAAAAPHDTNIEAGGAPSLTLAPGASATVGCRLFLQYVVGSPDGIDQFNAASSIVRVYGYPI